MATLADSIERELKKMLAADSSGILELQRGHLAERFKCVPSQISYVLETRFTVERGFLVESKRGGGGYIRIVQLTIGSRRDLIDRISRQIGNFMEQERAGRLIGWLEEEQHLTPREAAALRAMIHRETLVVDLPLRDLLRARILKAALPALLGRAPAYASGEG